MGEGLRMVHLRTVPDAWHAKVLAARLGAEGIITHLTGSVSGPYPFGAVSVHVEASQAELASELLLADEVESAFVQHEVPMGAAGYGGDDILPGQPGPGASYFEDDAPRVIMGPGDDVDLRVFDAWADEDAAQRQQRHRQMSRKRRAMAALAALVVAGAPVLAHFVGQ